jgi:hypothetical protein
VGGPAKSPRRAQGWQATAISAIAYPVVRDPVPILCLLPTDSDCRDFLVFDVDPLFEASPALRDRLPTTAGRDARNTLMHRIYPGGSLKVVAGKAPRDLRRDTCRILMIDEADALVACSPILISTRSSNLKPARIHHHGRLLRPALAVLAI